MNEEIEYAEMLEIPVSTVNVVQKKRVGRRKSLRKKRATETHLKQSLIEQVNDAMQQTNAGENVLTAEAQLFAEGANSEGTLRFDDVPERIDTLRLYSASDRLFKESEFALPEQETEQIEPQYDDSRYALNENKTSRRTRLILGIEFGAVCALCGAIFLTNVLLPGSAINNFFRTLNQTRPSADLDARPYSAFTLTPVVSNYSDAELSLSPTGILSFQDDCCVYPATDGKVREITQNADGSYMLKIAHSDTFSGVIDGLDVVYYQVGDEVKANVPVGYTDGERQVQVTMYSQGALLNCFQLTEENCLAWVTQD